MDVNKEIRRVVETGKTTFGFKSTEKNVLTGQAKAIVMSGNLPKSDKEKLNHYAKIAKIPIIAFNGTSLELGNVCGKPFTISTLTILDAGNSNLLESIEK